jgi:membrane protease YdiL (CAAX protease family)
MLSEKPWKPDLVLRLLAGLFSSMLLGVLIVNGYESLAGEVGKRGRDFFIFIVGVFSFHGVGIVLVNVFLRQHGMSWQQAFGFNSPRVGRAVSLALVVGVFILPIAWELSDLSAKALHFLNWRVEQQTAVQIMQNATSRWHLFYQAVAAIIIAPFVEETIFRGILYPTIKQLGFRKAALWGTSLFFAFTHANLVIFLPLVVLAIILTLLYETTNNLLAPIVTHSFFNAANFAYLLWIKHKSGSL